ncbi:MAG: ATP-binding protein [Pseudomonadota bacterium]
MQHSYLPPLLDALQEAVFVLDDNRHVLATNPAAEAIFGRGFVGNDFVHVVRHPDCLSAIARVLEQGGTQRVAFTVDMPVNATYQLVVADLGENHEDGARLVLSMTDTSDKREAQQMRADFVANVSHELRSPLTAISGFIETLRTSAKGDEGASERFLSLMALETERMVRLIADLLSLSKVQASQRQRPKGTADLLSVVSRVRNSLTSLTHNERTEIEIEQPDFASTVPGSPDELTQVFQNLIENAVKYSQADTVVRVSFEARERAPGIEGPAIAISVRDTGEGIAQEHIFRLTERFYRVDTHRSRHKGGTGLGLAIVKHIITRHRGRLSIASEKGVGSNFTVLLPRTLPQAKESPRL